MRKSRVNVDGSSLPKAIIRHIWRDVETLTHPFKSTGSFLSHMRIWETIIRSNGKGGIVMEDDCMPIYHPFSAIEKFAAHDVDLAFMNDRIASNDFADRYDDIFCNPSRKVYFDWPRTIGADFYYVSRKLVEHMLGYVENNGLFTVSDLFLLQHASPEGWPEPISIVPAPGEHVDEEYLFQAM